MDALGRAHWWVVIETLHALLGGRLDHVMARVCREWACCVRGVCAGGPRTALRDLVATPPLLRWVLEDDPRALALLRGAVALRQQVAGDCVASGSFDLLTTIRAQPTVDLLVSATRVGGLAAVRALVAWQERMSLVPLPVVPCVEAALAARRADVARWLLARDGRFQPRMLSDVVATACVRGDVAVVAEFFGGESALAADCAGDALLARRVAAGLAQHGDVHALQRLFVRRGVALHASALEAAAAAGQLATTRWLAARGVPRTLMLWPAAARGGSIAVLELVSGWLDAATLTVECCVLAAQHGHRDALRWLRACGCPWDATVTAAAAGAHASVLRWALAAGCAVDARASLAASRAGSVAALEVLEQAGSPRHPDAVCAAIDAGALPVLVWLLQHDFPHDARACERGVAHGAADAHRALLAHASPPARLPLPCRAADAGHTADD